MGSILAVVLSDEIGAIDRSQKVLYMPIYSNWLAGIDAAKIYWNKLMVLISNKIK